MKRYSIPLIAAATLALLGAASSAWAHFVWISVEQVEGKPVAHVWFSESAEPGEAELIERIAGVKLQALLGEKSSTLQTEVHKSGDEGALTAALQARPDGLVAHIDYGVLAKGDAAPFRLQYFARYAELGDEATPGAETPEFDLMPQRFGDSWGVIARVGGRPTPGLEVVALSPRGEEKKGQTDAQGRYQLGAPSGGLWSIRAKHVLPGAGEVNGKSFQETRRYATLTLRAPGAPAPRAGKESAAAPAKQPAASSDKQASEAGARLLREARETRAVWKSFPGFRAKLTVRSGEQVEQGSVTIAADGKVTLEGIKHAEKDVLTTLRSLAGHRLPGNELPDGGTIVAESSPHPLGQLVKLDHDTAMASAYRIEDRVVRQVNRQMGGGKFTISVLDVHRNPESHYLPSVYTVSFWNEDGSLRSSTTVREEWARLHGLDLPQRRLAVTAAKGDLRYEELIFAEHELLPTAGSSSTGR